MSPHSDGHLCPMPFDKPFYLGLLERRQEWTVASRQLCDDSEGRVCHLDAGQALRIGLLEGPQIVHVFPFNRIDPDERYYAQHTILIESIWLTRFSRLFGTMARYRPLATVLEDAVTSPRRQGLSRGWHHPAFGGWATPADWQRAGGSPGARSAWDQLAKLMREMRNDPSLIKDEVCFFQKVAVEPDGNGLRHLRSDALAGDYVTLFAELDLTVLIALSPYRDGSRADLHLGDGSPRAVELTVFDRIDQPLSWPYPGEPYPQIDGYLDPAGHRSERPPA